MIDPGKLADAAATRAREASDRLSIPTAGIGSLIAPPLDGRKHEILEAACAEVREAFIAGARFAESIQAARPSEMFMRMEQAAVDREQAPKRKPAKKKKPIVRRVRKR